MNDLDLVIITGAGRGIGKAIALEISKNVFVLCISKSETSFYASEQILRNGGKAESLAVDISDYKSAKTKVADWIKNKPYKRIGLVLAAAVLGPKGPIHEASLTEWDNCNRINVLGNLSVFQAVLPVMLKNKFGRIVFFGGGGAAYANPVFPAYSATKTSIVRTVENLHEDLKDKGDFSVVCLAPGAVQTDMLKEFMESGGEVKTFADVSEPVNFVKDFLFCENCNFSGSFVHVKDNWKEFTNSSKVIDNSSKWKLRRID